MDQRNADERKRLIRTARLRAVQKATILANITYHLGLASLGDKTSDALANMIAAKRTLLGIERTSRGDYSKLIALKERKCAAQHSHAALKNAKDVFKKLANIAFPRNCSGNFA